jgi:hypothetical protein
VEPETPPTEGGETPPPTEPEDVDARVASLLAQAAGLFDEADAALRDGDLALYQQKVNEAQDAVAEAQRLLGIEPPTEATTTTTGSA